MVKFFKKNRNLIIIFNRVFEVLVNILILLIIKKVIDNNILND